MTDTFEPISRSHSPELDAILGKVFPVLDKGFIRVIDYMGTEASIVQAARVSYGKGTKAVSDDVKLIRYLMRHRHCYTPEMEVLTIRGWKRWDQCDYTETFLVPDPKTRTYQPESLPVEVFDCDEEIQTFRSGRMSYRVTSDHRMWFQGKYQEEFDIVRASKMAKWGHFDPAVGYAIPHDQRADPLGRLIGFTLGDGSGAGSGVSFHLRKERKKAYLRQCAVDLGITLTESPSGTYPDAIVFYLKAEDMRRLGLGSWLQINLRAADKELLAIPDDPALAYGILDGLINSDGHVNENRGNRIEYSSASPKLIDAFETLATMFGFDAHRGGEQCDVQRVTAFPTGGRTSLEARPHYFGTEHYAGRVYCATTSTGLLMVRGGPDKFGFVCGNTTPFEMCELKLHIKIPMDAWRQMVRHRTASINEYSTRYSEAIDDMQETQAGAWRLQSGSNRQGSSGLLDSWPVEWERRESGGATHVHVPGYGFVVIDYPEAKFATVFRTPGEFLTHLESVQHVEAHRAYQAFLALGVAREQARKELPLSTYTEAYWKIDLHNLLHFLSLRMDSHAQQEIRDYANQIGDIVGIWLPNVWEAFKDYRQESMTLSQKDIAVIRGLMVHWKHAIMVATEFGWTKEISTDEISDVVFDSKNREAMEFWQKIRPLGLAGRFEGGLPA